MLLGGDGTGPGQFDTPHAVRVDKDDRVLVADRTNSRIRIFDVDGHFQEEWTHRLDANDLFIDGDGIVYLAEAPKRLSIMALQGNVLTEWDEEGEEPGQIKEAPHGIWVDSHGDIYLCEVPWTAGRLTKYERV